MNLVKSSEFCLTSALTSKQFSIENILLNYLFKYAPRMVMPMKYHIVIDKHVTMREDKIATTQLNLPQHLRKVFISSNNALCYLCCFLLCSCAHCLTLDNVQWHCMML